MQPPLSIEHYRKRRNRLTAMMTNGSLMLLSAATEQTRNRDCHFPFRQRSDFYYLTGFNEPQALLCIEKIDDTNTRCLLFNRENDPSQELWSGQRLGQSGAITALGIDEAYPHHEIDTQLPSLLANKSAVYYCPITDREVHHRLPQWLQTLQISRAWRKSDKPATHHDLASLLGQLRQIKQAEEVAVMRQVAQISAEAHCQAMRAVTESSHEYQLQAVIEQHCLHHGCSAMAYPSIVAAGSNACVLHYTDNRNPIADEDYVLIDAGGELDNYAADITRTFPKSGRFSGIRADVYAMVLSAQSAGIACARVGQSWETVQQAVLRVLAQGLIDLGILEHSVDSIIEESLYLPYYMHGAGHWLGLDVHDVGDYCRGGQPVTFVPGMAITVEPGLYFGTPAPEVPQALHQFGVRIEDDVLITADDPEVLSAYVPKTMAAIEGVIRD